MQLWEQWNQRSTELMKGVGSRAPSGGVGAGSPEEVLDAVFDFAEHMIEQQRAFAKQMLKAAGKGQDMVTDAGETTRARPCHRYPASRRCRLLLRPKPRRRCQTRR